MKTYTYTELLQITHYLYTKYHNEFEGQEGSAVARCLRESEHITTEHDWYKFVMYGQLLHLCKQEQTRWQLANDALRLVDEGLLPLCPLEPGEVQNLVQIFVGICQVTRGHQSAVGDLPGMGQ